MTFIRHKKNITNSLVRSFTDMHIYAASGYRQPNIRRIDLSIVSSRPLEVRRVISSKALIFAVSDMPHGQTFPAHSGDHSRIPGFVLKLSWDLLMASTRHAPDNRYFAGPRFTGKALAGHRVYAKAGDAVHRYSPPSTADAAKTGIASVYLCSNL